MRHGVVDSVGTGTIDVQLDGVVVTAQSLDGVTFTAGDVATLIQDGRRLVAIGFRPLDAPFPPGNVDLMADDGTGESWATWPYYVTSWGSEFLFAGGFMVEPTRPWAGGADPEPYLEGSTPYSPAWGYSGVDRRSVLEDSTDSTFIGARAASDEPGVYPPWLSFRARFVGLPTAGSAGGSVSVAARCKVGTATTLRVSLYAEDLGTVFTDDVAFTTSFATYAFTGDLPVNAYTVPGVLLVDVSNLNGTMLPADTLQVSRLSCTYTA